MSGAETIVGSDPPVFYYDLVSPFSGLAAFRIEEVMPVAPVWRPIWSAPVILGSGRKWRPSFAEGRARRADIVRRAKRYGMPEWRWPTVYEPASEAEHEAWTPPNSLRVMRMATLAVQKGVGPAFSLGVFALVFAEGHELSASEGAIVEIGVDCGLDREELIAAPTTPAIKDALRAATDEAANRGVIGVPTVAIGRQLFWGDDRLDEAAAAAAAG